MQTEFGQGRIGWICVATIALFLGLLVQSQSPAAEDDGAGQKAFMRGAESFWTQDGGKYWLGVECREAQPELKAQLGLNDEGLVVVHLVDDGPGAKAGLKRHDVIVSAGDSTLKHLPDLIKAANAADGKEISLKIIRGGKEQTISVTPAERPQDNSQIIARPGPGFMWPGGGPRVELPDNVTVTIVRQGKQPAKITVTRGDEKWEISDQQLNKLPEELRPAVERMVGAGAMNFPFSGGFNMPGMRIEGMPFHLDFHHGPPGSGSPPRDDEQGPPPRDGDNNPPPPGRNPPPRDGENGPPPPGGFSGGFGWPTMQPGQVPPELMQRLERLDRRLEMLQDELRRLQDGGPGGPPRMRPRPPGNGPDGPPPGPPEREPPPNDR